MVSLCFFFFNDTATTEIYTLSLHDALPISEGVPVLASWGRRVGAYLVDSLVFVLPLVVGGGLLIAADEGAGRSEEHTSELQSRQYLVCRLLLEKKKKKYQSQSYLRPLPKHQ